MSTSSMDLNRQPSERFRNLKASLIQQRRLFEDHEFPAGMAALGDNRGFYEWRRPHEICKNPVFVLNGIDKSDLYQGQLKDCWFIAGAACMASAHAELLERCIQAHQSFQQSYAGIFCFYFWRFGEWVEVIIDDLLPTAHGRLVFGCNKTQPNEFWVPLFEKAYAKLHNGYSNLEGGFSNNALVDFTGGTSELIELKHKLQDKDKFCRELYHMIQNSSMFGAHITGNTISEMPLPNGLYEGHAYSIVNLVMFHQQDKMLMQLRNPWGRKEWNGPWSDGSVEWQNIPEDDKQRLSLTIKDDGDFWMEFDDFIHNFQFMTICHLDLEGARAIGSKEKKEWKIKSFRGEWIKGFNAGGADDVSLWINPQYSVTVDLEGAESTMVVSLMQNTINQTQNTHINFKIFKLKDPQDRVVLNRNNQHQLAERVPHTNTVFMNMREASDHITVTPGKYIIIPCTLKRNISKQFLLRVYTETRIQSETVDLPTTIETIFDPLQKDFDEAFRVAAKGTDNVDPKEMMDACNQILTKDGLFWTIGLETSRNLLALLDKDRNGVITLVEFRKIMKEVLKWKERFKIFDRDLSGDIDTFELNQIFKSIGFNISRKVLETIFRRYGGKRCRLSFEDFVHACSKIINLYEVFMHKRDHSSPPRLTLPLEEWLSTTLYL